MSFNFPISPNFSITGQPIAHLIKGDVPVDYYKRVELFDAVLDKYASIHVGHEKARANALASQTGGSGFTLYLRNFGIEEYRYSDDPTERMYNFRFAQFEKMIQELVKRAGSALFSLCGGNDQLDEFLGRGKPVFTGQSQNWHALAVELIQAAKAIVIFANDMSPGLLEEIKITQSLRKTSRAIVYLSKASKTLAEMLNNKGDPDTFMSLKSHFLEFENVYEPPQLEGWNPSFVNEGEKLPTWPGAKRLHELLSDLYTGTNEMRTVRTVACQILNQTELQSPEGNYLWKRA
jgi:hypothetical protein